LISSKEYRYLGYQEFEEEGTNFFKSSIHEIATPFLYRHAIMAQRHVEVKLMYEACMRGMSFIFGLVDVLVKVLAGTQGAIPSQEEERSRDQEVGRPC